MSETCVIAALVAEVWDTLPLAVSLTTTRSVTVPVAVDGRRLTKLNTLVVDAGTVGQVTVSTVTCTLVPIG